MPSDPRFEGCHGQGCGETAVVKVSGPVGEFVPLCLSCLRREVEHSEPGDFEVALQRRSGDRLDGLGAVVEVLAALPVQEPVIRLGLAPAKMPVPDVANDVTWPADAEPERCAFEACTFGAIASVNPMLRKEDVLRACKRHLGPAVARTQNPEVRPPAPWLLPHAADALAGLAESIFAVQILFHMPAGTAIETTAPGAEAGKKAPPGERPFLIF